MNPQGGIWIGFSDGDLARFDKGHWAIIPFHRPKNIGAVLRLVNTSEGGVLAATGGGLAGWRNGTPKILTAESGLPCNRINSLIYDARNTLWLYTACGLVSISDLELQRWWKQSDTKIAVRIFDILDGAQPAPTPFQPSATLSADGRIWFVNGNVVQGFDPSHISSNVVSPPVHIEQVIADQKEYPVSGELRLPALTRELEIDYTALSFVIPQRVRFRYKLDGWQNEWQDAGTRRQAFYTNLRPGPYRFQVAACNDDGVWNNIGAALSFAIAPAYYQTVWFEVLCAIAFLGILWSSYLLRLRQATEQIQQRLGARLEERERIARELHDTLLQGFQGLMLRFQAVLKTLPANEPARGMMEDVMDRADGVLLEGRQRVRDLREEGQSSDELSQAVMGCGEDLSQGRSSAFSLAVTGTVQPLDPIVFNEVYRIAREALANAFQHSGAARIEADLTYSGTQLCVRIRDDGRGVDEQILSSGKTGHWGLSGMRERAEKIGAQLKIWSRPGAGTEVEVIITAKVAYTRTRKSSPWFRRQERHERKNRGLASNEENKNSHGG
jgi:signal transduction histidine kinase